MDTPFLLRAFTDFQAWHTTHIGYCFITQVRYKGDIVNLFSLPTPGSVTDLEDKLKEELELPPEKKVTLRYKIADFACRQYSTTSLDDTAEYRSTNDRLYKQFSTAIIIIMRDADVE